MENKTKNYLIKNQQQDNIKLNNQINIIKTESKQENDIFNKFLNSQISTYSKISQINNNNIKKSLKERQKLLEKSKEKKENQLKISINKGKSSSLNKDITDKYKEIQLKNKINEDFENKLKNFKFIINLKDSVSKIKVNKCSSAHKTSYSKILNPTTKKFENKKQERISNSPDHTFGNTTLAFTYGNLPNLNNNISINSKTFKESSFMEIYKEKANIYHQKNLMEFSTPEELHYFQVNVTKAKNKLAFRFENCEENFDNIEDNEIISTVLRIESINFFD
jgi:hypothetical protein